MRIEKNPDKRVIFFASAEKDKKFLTELCSVLWDDFRIESHIIYLEGKEKLIETLNPDLFNKKVLFAHTKTEDRNLFEELKKYISTHPVVYLESDRPNSLGHSVIKILKSDFQKLKSPIS